MIKCTHCVGLVAAALVAFPGGSALGQESETAGIVGGMIEHNRTYATGLNLTVEVARSAGPGFDALLGPLPGAAVGTATAFSATEVGSGTEMDLMLELQGQNGFIYMTGVQPYGGTDGGSSTSEGTSMVIQRITVNGTVFHRFFRLESSKNVLVKDDASPPNERTIKHDYKYVEREGAGSLSDPIGIPKASQPDDDGVRAFILLVLDLAANAGLDTPPDPP